MAVLLAPKQALSSRPERRGSAGCSPCFWEVGHGLSQTEPLGPASPSGMPGAPGSAPGPGGFALGRPLALIIFYFFIFAKDARLQRGRAGPEGP